MKKIILLILVSVALFSFSGDTSKDLEGLVVILDPGHGGTDEGAFGYYGIPRVKIIESAYCYDIALRIERKLLSRGALVYKTIKSKQIFPIDNNNLFEIEKDTNTVFSYDGTRVSGTLLGLNKRVMYANKKLLIYPKHKFVYIAIHFDKLSDHISGTRIISGHNELVLSETLKNEFKNNNLLTFHKFPILKNGDKTKGIRNLVVLKKENKIREKVLIEFGNFNNQTDLAKLVDYKEREVYANIVSNSLVNYMKLFK